MVKALKGYIAPRSPEELTARYAQGERMLHLTRLRGADLSAMKLSGANLSYSDLQQVTACSTDLTGANLSHTDLQNAVLTDAHSEDRVTLDKTRVALQAFCELASINSAGGNFDWRCGADRIAGASTAQIAMNVVHQFIDQDCLCGRGVDHLHGKRHVATRRGHPVGCGNFADFNDG